MISAFVDLFINEALKAVYLIVAVVVVIWVSVDLLIDIYRGRK